MYVSVCVHVCMCACMCGCRVNEGLALHSSSPELLFLKAKIMWESPDVERSQVYAVLVKVCNLHGGFQLLF